MEGSFYHPPRPLWIHSHVLQLLQCSTHIPSFHEPHLCWYDCRTLVENLHGRPWHPHQWHPHPPSWTHSLCPPMPSRAWSLSQNLQMLFQYIHHGIPGHDHWTRTCSYGSYKTLCDLYLETTHLCQGSSFLSRLCQFLSEVYPQLLQHRHSPHRPYQERPTLDLEPPLTMSLWHPS